MLHTHLSRLALRPATCGLVAALGLAACGTGQLTGVVSGSGGAAAAQDNAAAAPKAGAAAPAASGAAGAAGGTALTPPAAATLPGMNPNVWLHTLGNRILRRDGSVWVAHGLNFPDMRSCGACAFVAPSAALSIRDVDQMVDVWGAHLLRMTLESRSAAQTILQDAAYLAAVKAVVDHVATKKDVYLMLSFVVDPGLTDQGWPTAAVNQEMARLAAVFADYPFVILAPANEPSANYDHAQDSQVWAAMNAAVAAVRAVEDAAHKPHHLVAVQGTGGWARTMSYYIDHPIAAGGGDNVIYETHAYLAQADFDRMWGDCAKVRPVLIGEYGPLGMSADDIAALEARIHAQQLSSMVWTFHPRCGDLSMLEDDGRDLCDPSLPEPAPNAWGSAYRARLPGL